MPCYRKGVSRPCEKRRSEVKGQQRNRSAKQIPQVALIITMPATEWLLLEEKRKQFSDIYCQANTYCLFSNKYLAE